MPTPWHTPPWPPMRNTHNQKRTCLNFIWTIAAVLHHTFQTYAVTVLWKMTYLHTFSYLHILYRFSPHFRHSKFLTLHSLTFKPSCATCELLPSASTRSYMPSFYFVKNVKPKSAMMHSWLQKQITHILRSRPFSSQWPITHIRIFTSYHSHRISTTL